MDEKYRRNRLKKKELILFQNDPVWFPFCHGQGIGGNGKSLGQTGGMAPEPQAALELQLKHLINILGRKTG
jgi:hypothetical protein